MFRQDACLHAVRSLFISRAGRSVDACKKKNKNNDGTIAPPLIKKFDIHRLFRFASRRLRLLGFFFGSVFCIMSSSNNGHKVSYKRCQNIAFIIANESTHPPSRRRRASGPSIRNRARF